MISVVRRRWHLAVKVLMPRRVITLSAAATINKPITPAISAATIAFGSEGRNGDSIGPNRDPASQLRGATIAAIMGSNAEMATMSTTADKATNGINPIAWVRSLIERSDSPSLYSTGRNLLSMVCRIEVSTILLEIDSIIATLKHLIGNSRSLFSS